MKSENLIRRGFPKGIFRIPPLLYTIIYPKHLGLASKNKTVTSLYYIRIET